jgi:hypothetical protein
MTPKKTPQKLFIIVTVSGLGVLCKDSPYDHAGHEEVERTQATTFHSIVDVQRNACYQALLRAGAKMTIEALTPAESELAVTREPRETSTLEQRDLNNLVETGGRPCPPGTRSKLAV